MSLSRNTIALGAAIGVAASLAFAGAHAASPESRAVEAHQSKMTLFAFNIGVLGAMAKGATEDDAAGADLAALRGAIGPVGEACGSCHKPYRAKLD